MGTETELKLLPASREQGLVIIGGLAEACGADVFTERYRNTYYDTPDKALSALGLSLRLRVAGDNTLATLKNSGVYNHGIFSRGEWETPALTLTDALPALRSLGAPLPSELKDAELFPEAETEFSRTGALISVGSMQIEAVLDDGVLRAGGKEEPFFEMELELRAGDAAEFTRFSEELVRRHGLIFQDESKHRRALALLQKGSQMK